MTQYKFRGKRVDNGQWVFGYLVSGGLFGGNVDQCWIFSSDFRFHNVFPETVGQFTGINDKNGKEIYDSDIVRMHQFLFDGTEVEHEHTGIVKYNEATASFHYTQITGKFYSEHTGHAEGEDTVGVPISTFYGLHEESFEIIGNIHNNPETIKRTS